MRKSVKIFLVVCNLLFLALAGLWYYTSKEYEPLIVMGQSVVTLVTVLFGDKVVKQIEISGIKGESEVEVNKDANAKIDKVSGKSKVKIK